MYDKNASALMDSNKSFVLPGIGKFTAQEVIEEVNLAIELGEMSGIEAAYLLSKAWNGAAGKVEAQYIAGEIQITECMTYVSVSQLFMAKFYDMAKSGKLPAEYKTALRRLQAAYKNPAHRDHETAVGFFEASEDADEYDISGSFGTVYRIASKIRMLNDLESMTI
jgi:hypothetical protein